MKVFGLYGVPMSGLLFLLISPPDFHGSHSTYRSLPIYITGQLEILGINDRFFSSRLVVRRNTSLRKLVLFEWYFSSASSPSDGSSCCQAKQAKHHTQTVDCLNQCQCGKPKTKADRRLNPSSSHHKSLSSIHRSFICIEKVYLYVTYRNEICIKCNFCKVNRFLLFINKCYE